MLDHKHHLISIVVAAALSATGAVGASADTIYTYTGMPFTSALSPYTTSDYVSGWIDLAAPLSAGRPLTGIVPVSFSFSDGLQTITASNALSGSVIDLATDSSADISYWLIVLYDEPTYTATVLTFNCPSCGLSVAAADQGINSSSQGGSTIDSPGTWTVSTTPLPAALPLFATGLGAMGLLGWRRKRKNAAAIAA